MPRPLRIHVPGVPLHLVQRGHNRAPCFFADEDYRCYLHLLGKVLPRSGIELHAYVLMTNHVHLLVTPGTEQETYRAVIALGSRYVRYVNDKYGRVGTLWDGRYRSSPIQTERYLFACQRYIELNPMRAGIVRDPGDYLWSSYRHHAFGEQDRLVKSTTTYAALGDSAAARQSAYREACGEPVDYTTVARIRHAFNRCEPCGDPQFVEGLEQATGHVCQRPSRGRPRKSPA